MLTVVKQQLNNFNKGVQTMADLQPFYLTDEQIKRLQDMDSNIKFFKSELQRAEYCGLDVTSIRKRVDEMELTRLKMIETYKKPD